MIKKIWLIEVIAMNILEWPGSAFDTTHTTARLDVGGHVEQIESLLEKVRCSWLNNTHQDRRIMKWFDWKCLCSLLIILIQVIVPKVMAGFRECRTSATLYKNKARGRMKQEPTQALFHENGNHQRQRGRQVAGTEMDRSQSVQKGYSVTVLMVLSWQCC